MDEQELIYWMVMAVKVAVILQGQICKPAAEPVVKPWKESAYMIIGKHSGFQYKREFSTSRVIALAHSIDLVLSWVSEDGALRRRR